jgi:hypothetical protein
MCDSGWSDCDGLAADGCEANLQNDPNNCGSCGETCTPDNMCQGGICGCECPKGTAFCPGDTACCETMLGTNENCNFCGDTCDLANAESQCMPAAPLYMCTLVTCNPGYANCDMMATNGCEVDTQTDPANCGACGNACAPNDTCAGGMCQ